MDDRPYTEPLLSRAREETSLLGFVNVLLKHRRIIGGTILIGTLVMLASAIMEARWYTTRVAFVARGSDSGFIGGLAQQFGLSIVGSDPSQSIEFYEELLRSTELLREVAKHQYVARTPKGIVRGTLPVFYGIHAGSRDAEIDITADRIKENIITAATRRTGIISFFFSAPYPEIAQQVSNNMVAELNKYNAVRRKSQVSAERQFIEQRMEEAKIAVAVAENNLRNFQEVNREYATSPRLAIENDRLRRDIDMKQQLYTSLVTAYDKARMEEARNMPVISMVEPADLPLTPDVTYGVRNILLGAIAGMLVGIVIAFIRERIYETRAEGTQSFMTFSALKQATLRDIARPWQRFRPERQT